jgi:predicted nucleic acid-binding protein
MTLRPRVTIDTNVVFEGLTKRGGAAGLIIDAWLAELLDVRVSDALAFEYADVLSRLLSESRWQSVRPVLGRLLAISSFVAVHYSWRPMSPDPADEHVIDCAMNAGAVVVTFNRKDFRSAEKSLGLRVITPVELVVQLADY